MYCSFNGLTYIAHTYIFLQGLQLGARADLSGNHFNFHSECLRDDQYVAKYDRSIQFWIPVDGLQ